MGLAMLQRTAYQTPPKDGYLRRCYAQMIAEDDASKRPCSEESATVRRVYVLHHASTLRLTKDALEFGTSVDGPRPPDLEHRHCAAPQRSSIDNCLPACAAFSHLRWQPELPSRVDHEVLAAARNRACASRPLRGVRGCRSARGRTRNHSACGPHRGCRHGCPLPSLPWAHGRRRPCRRLHAVPRFDPPPTLVEERARGEPTDNPRG